eukprot:TRINITY_DN2884_c0_g1_i5.p3 TRINITY_DN2884_c0_g1~~TRINITY_DN2884_c0_g1_i5.p3  ORF type:complete len:172 (-),score=19.62 TRINITY_DN2884_c0_g1_i5:434-949(-)
MEDLRKQQQQKEQELQAAYNLLASHGIDVSCEEARCQQILPPAGSVDGSAVLVLTMQQPVVLDKPAESYSPTVTFRAGWGVASTSHCFSSKYSYFYKIFLFLFLLFLAQLILFSQQIQSLFFVATDACEICQYLCKSLFSPQRIFQHSSFIQKMELQTIVSVIGCIFCVSS